jgi:hypothetical protein
MLSLKLLLLLASLSPAAAGPQVMLLGPQAKSDATQAEVISVDVADLQDQLEAGLRARRSEEFAFIARVVQFVEQGKLRRQLVAETFQWAREKQPYPYVYFQRAMKLRAAKEGVQL